MSGWWSTAATPGRSRAPMNEEQRAKEISAADFGLPVARRAPAHEYARRHAGGATSRGGSFVAFYASQSDEISLELAVPRGAPHGAAELGLGLHRRDGGALAARAGRDLSRPARRDRAVDARADPAAHAPDPGPRRRRARPAAARRAVAARRRAFPSTQRDRRRPDRRARAGTVVALYDRAGGDAARPCAGDAGRRAAAEIVPVTFPCTLQDGVPVVRTREPRATRCRRRESRIVVLPVTRMTLRISRPRDWPGRAAAPTVRRSRRPRWRRSARRSRLRIDDTRPDFIWYRTADGARFMPSVDRRPTTRSSGRRRRSTRAAPRRPPARIRRGARPRPPADAARAGAGALPSNGLPIGVATATTSLVRYDRDAAGRCRFAGQRTTLDKNAAVNTCDGAERADPQRRHHAGVRLCVRARRQLDAASAQQCVPPGRAEPRRHRRHPHRRPAIPQRLDRARPGAAHPQRRAGVRGAVRARRGTAGRSLPVRPRDGRRHALDGRGRRPGRPRC